MEQDYDEKILMLLNWIDYTDIAEGVVLLIITLALATYLVVKKRKRRFEISIVTSMALKYASILVYSVSTAVENQTPNSAILIFISMNLASGLIVHLIYAL